MPYLPAWARLDQTLVKWVLDVELDYDMRDVQCMDRCAMCTEGNADCYTSIDASSTSYTPSTD